MKKIGQILMLAMVLAISAVHTAKAQEVGDLILDVNYGPSFPLSGFKDNVIGKTSWKGYSGDVMYHFHNKWAAGIGIGYQGYEEKSPRATYALNGYDVNGVLNTSIDLTPILAKAQFYPLGGSKAMVQPYIQMGAGIGIVDFQQYLGMYTTSNWTSGRFMAQGGIGLSIPFGKLTSNGLQLGANYNYVNYDAHFTDSNGNTSKVSNLGNVNAYVGVHFALR